MAEASPQHTRRLCSRTAPTALCGRLLLRDSLRVPTVLHVLRVPILFRSGLGGRRTPASP
eukprot:3380037-Pleurochrysis_carterae.AAC.2